MAFIDGHVAPKKIKGSAFTTSKVDPAPEKGEPAWYNASEGKKTVAGPMWNPRYCWDDLD